MKSILFAGAAFALSTSMAHALDGHEMPSRDDLVGKCEAAKAEGSKTDCGCLVDKAIEDADLMSNLKDADGDQDKLTPASKEAIAACQKTDM